VGDEESFPFPFLFCFFLFNLPAATYSVCLSFALSFFLVVAILGGKAKREQGAVRGLFEVVVDGGREKRTI